MQPLPLLHFAQRCVDAASGLLRIGDSLPWYTSSISAIATQIFTISSVLQRINYEEGNRNSASSFYRIREDLNTAFRTLGFTLDDIFDVFVQVKDRPVDMVWEDLQYRLELEGSFSLIDRLRLYHDFFETQFRFLERQEAADPVPLRQSVYILLEAQERARARSRPSVPRARHASRPTLHRMETPTSPSVYSDHWDTDYLSRPRQPAPEPPQPLSPTYTSGSSQTMGSSRTSYSSGVYSLAPPRSALAHWSLRVFDGQHPTTEYAPAYRSNERSVCHGEIEPDAVRNLALDGFQPALRVAFDEESLSVQFYWRPSDQRARILIVAKDLYGRPAYYCRPLNYLKIIRDRSTLQLCLARRGDGRYELWSRLNFSFHERMVLFYSTFTAMKRQDQGGVILEPLVDRFELESEHGEECQFSGQIQHGHMFHAVRLFRDRGSGAVRLEVAALRGSKKDLALWTAFVTKYTHDPDWAAIERGVVSLAAFKPPPYVFAAQYEPPRDRDGTYVLPFTTGQDAAMFTQTWAQLCSSYRRST